MISGLSMTSRRGAGLHVIPEMRPDFDHPSLQRRRNLGVAIFSVGHFPDHTSSG